jgi:hypothetical protein
MVTSPSCAELQQPQRGGLRRIPGTNQVFASGRDGENSTTRPSPRFDDVTVMPARSNISSVLARVRREFHKFVAETSAPRAANSESRLHLGLGTGTS